MSLKKNVFGTFYIIRNLLLTPALRFLLFFCICIQTFIAFWGFYNIWNVNSWSNIYDVTENVSNYFTKVIECFISFALLTSVLVKTKTFLGEPAKLRFSLFNDIGFRSVWMGMGTFYIICCSITDDEAMNILTEQVQFMATDTESLKEQIRFVYWARYILCVAGVLCIAFSIFLKFGQKLPCCGHLFDFGNVDDEDAHARVQPKKWTRVPTKINKLLLFIFYFFMMSFSIFVISVQIIYLYFEFKGYTVATATTAEEVTAIVEEVVGAKLMYGLPDLVIALVILQRFAKQFWYKPYKPAQSITILLYVYQLFSVHAQAKKYSTFIVQDGWNVSEDLFRKVCLGLLITYIAFPILFWTIFIVFGKHHTDDLTSASGSDTNDSMTLIKSVFMRIFSPISAIFRKYIFKPIKWYTAIYTLAVLFGLAGGVATALSQTYEKFYIDFQGLDVLNKINDDFLTINNKIVDVSNGFVVVAANLNPCMDYTKTSSGGSSISSLIAKQVTTAGTDGHAGSNPDSSKTVIQQLHDESTDANFKKDCFKEDNKGKLIYSGDTKNPDCKNVENLSNNDFGIQELKNKEASNTETPPSCPDEATCLANSQSVIKDQYELTLNKECENAACGVFIGGLVAAFAASFIPFGGPAIGKGLQVALRITKGVKQFGKVFKRVATQVKSKLSKIKSLYSTFSKILGDSNLKVVNNYQFFYFLAPAMLLMVVAFGLGFFRRRKASSASKTVFLSFFALVAGVCGTFTYLSFIFTDILTEMFTPFSAFANVSIKTAVGMDMIKWGYALSTVSSLLFLLAAVYSNIAYYIFGKSYDAPSNDQLNEHERQEMVEEEKRRRRRVKAAAKHPQKKRKEEYVNKFSGWLVAFILTIPVYYLIFLANSNQSTLLTIQLTPSAGLEEVRVTFGHTNALEREFGSADDLNDETNENLCDIVASAVKGIIDSMKLPIPGGSIKGLFDVNIGIRQNVADVIQKVRDAVTLNVNGFNLFDGNNFPTISLSFASWQMILVFGVSIFIVVGTAVCFLFTFIQQIGFLRESRILGQIIMPFFEQVIIPASIGSFFVQLAIVGLFSFMDGFQTPMFSLSMQVGPMVTYGLLASVVCMVASVFRIMTEYAPIADDSTDGLIEEAADEEAGIRSTTAM